MSVFVAHTRPALLPAPSYPPYLVLVLGLSAAYFPSQLLHSPVVAPQSHGSTSLSLRFLICELEVKIVLNLRD